MRNTNHPNWVTRPLGELTDKIGSGATPRGGQSAYKESGISLIRSLNVHDLEFRYKDLARIDDEQAAALSNVDVQACDVLLNITGASIARCSQVPKDVLPARVNQHVSILRPKSDVLDNRFLSYFLVSKSTKDQLLNIGDKAGATRQALTKAQLQGFKIPVPQLDEQKRIVAVLDHTFAALDRARAHAKTNLSDAGLLADTFLDDQIRSLTDKFGRIRVDTIAEIKGGKRLPKGVKPEAERTRYPYISVRDMDGAGSVTEDTVGFISETTQHSIRRYTISCADIYISIAGTIGKTGVVPDALDGANLTENAAKLVLEDGWLRDFVYWSTRSTDFREQTAEQTRVAAQPKLALQRLGCITIPNANRKSQEKLVDGMVRFRDCITAAKSSYRKKLTDIADLRQSILQKAFSGELV